MIMIESLVSRVVLAKLKIHGVADPAAHEWCLRWLEQPVAFDETRDSISTVTNLAVRAYLLHGD